MKNLFLSNNLLRPIWLAILVFFVVTPRFNRHWTVFENSIHSVRSDDLHYEKLVENFQNSKNEIVPAPFAYRFAIPFIASLLPLSPYSALNFINAFLLLLSTFLLRSILKISLTTPKAINIGLILFIFSFPNFFYTTVGYIDVWLVFATVMAIIIFHKPKKIYAYFLYIFIACFVKESAIALLAYLWAIDFFRTKNYIRSLQILFFGTIAFVMSSQTCRQLAPVENTNYLWLPKIDYLIANLSRPKTYLSFILSLGIQGFLLLSLFFNQKGRRFLKNEKPMLVGFFSAIILWFYALFSAYADGRPLWLGFVFSTIIIAKFLDKRLKTEL